MASYLKGFALFSLLLLAVSSTTATKLSEHDIIVKLKDLQAMRKYGKDSNQLGRFSTPQIAVIVSAAITVLVSLVTLALAWFVTVSVYLRCKQSLTLCDDKLKVADALLGRRKFDEKVFEKLAITANFDIAKNAEEIKEKFDSIYEAQPKL